MNQSEEFADWTTLRTVRVQAVATWILRDVFNRLTKLEKELSAALFTSDVNGKASAADQRRALRDFAEQVDEKITEVYREILSRVEADFATLADKEEEAQRSAFIPFQIVRDIKPLAVGTLAILGANLRGWLGRQAGDLDFRVNQAAKQGTDAGESTAEIFRRIKGGADAAGVELPGVMTTSERAAEVLIRTGVTQVQSEVTGALADKLPASVDYGWQQISILDSRTTQICKAYAFKIWTKEFKPIGHSLPFNGGVPRHPNCRSRIVIYMLDDGPTKELTFRQWLDRLTPQQQDQIFGKNRIAMFKAGKLSEQDLIRQQWQAINPENINEQ